VPPAPIKSFSSGKQAEPNLVGAAVLFGVGLLLNYYTMLYAGGMTGAGHGIYIPLYTCRQFWMVSCPFLIAGANSGWPKVMIFARALVCLYYVWLLFHLGQLSHLPHEYARMAHKDDAGVFWIWAGLVLLTHSLIWLPVPTIRVWRTHLAKGRKGVIE
jgi:hypothetical protein